MGYQGEYATYQPVRRIAQSPYVQAMLASMQVPAEASRTTDVNAPISEISWARANEFTPDWVVSIDGSLCSVEIREDHQAACITVAAVFQDQRKVLSLAARRPIEPTAWQGIRWTKSIELALPGPGLSAFVENPGHPSFRRALYEALASLDILPTYEALLAYKPQSTRPQRSPYDECDRHIVPREGVWYCSCGARHKLYSIDALRLHDRLYPSSYETAFAETLMVLERLWLLTLLRRMEAEDRWEDIAQTAWIVDGPLAVFGSPAWLSQAIMRELTRINTQLLIRTGTDLLLIGVEKQGTFVRYLERIRRRLPAGGLLLLTDNYIKRYILGAGSATQFYGRNHYFGRRFFYRTTKGTLVSGMLPMLYPRARDLSTAHPPQYPRLEDALAVLEAVGCVRYPNALSPLAAAHAEAAIPSKLGGRVFSALVAEYVS